MQMPFQNKISTRSKKKGMYRGSVVDFDNGYSQRVTSGPASARKMDSWTVVFEQVRKTEMETIITFLDGVGNWDLFEATMPTDTVEKKYRVISDYDHDSIHDDNHTITFNIRQELA